jgi:hypothetical protein
MSPIGEEDTELLETFGPAGAPTELQFSYGKWPNSGKVVDDIDVLCCDGRHTRLHIRRHPRMTRRPTNIIHGDVIMASVDTVPAEGGSRTTTKHIRMRSIRIDDGQEEVPG